ncbi:MAG: 3-hydroxyacyl-CoA dehydrogenase NAD-binding domain-containing protein [Chloroflexota bacterium]
MVAEVRGGRVTTLGVLGAGTMGAGIVQVAAEAGIEVIVHDPLAGSVARARERIGGYLRRKVEKGTLDPEAAERALRCISEVNDVASLASADAVVEAIPEDLAMKREAFATLDAAAGPGALLLSNTSSLSIASIASATRHAGRVAGMHFFNPVPLMRLVEVVAGPATSEASVAATSAFAEQLGKSPVVSADMPGFIVNRVQRALYLEAYRILAEGTPLDAIDDALRGIGFRMGPFELADLVGTDVNLAAGTAIHAGFFGDPRYRPQPIQQRVVDAGRLGRKTFGGYYDYAPDGARGAPWSGAAVPDAPGLRSLPATQVEARALAAIVNEAASAVADGVAPAREIDRAMQLAANWPHGPLVWGERIGLEQVVNALDGLHAAMPDGRYRVTPLLRSLAEHGGSFFAQPT